MIDSVLGHVTKLREKGKKNQDLSRALIGERADDSSPAGPD